MIRTLILAGGTSTAWHLVNIIEKHYQRDIEVYVCDINPQYLIPSSKKSKKFIQVSAITSEKYYPSMLKILDENEIDIIIPLIDFDLSIFSKDNKDLELLKIKSTAPKKYVVELLSDKYNMSKWLNSIGVKVPKVYSLNEIENNKEYILKPRKGFGSRGVIKCKGNEIKEKYSTDSIIQEVCKPKEITVEVFKTEDTLKTICRERIEVKSGVCTKTRIFRDNELNNIVNKIVSNIEFPVASCIQFMLNEKGEWCVTDINLRLGAGTALSSKVGWQLASASLSYWIGNEKSYDDFFDKLEEEKYVVRVYEEIVMK